MNPRVFWKISLQYRLVLPSYKVYIFNRLILAQYSLVFMELCPESLLESSNLLVELLLLSLVGVADEDEELEAVVDCMDDLAELDLAELSAIIELEDDMAPSSVDS